MTTYEIKAGKQDFRPVSSWKPYWVSQGFDGYAILDPSCWYDWEGDRDVKDWNKLVGITKAWTANNNHSAMIAWRPASERFVFEVCGYTNYPGVGWKAGPPVKILAGERFYFEGRIWKNAAKYQIENERVEHPFSRHWLPVYREITPWIGGKNNEPGQYGGKASQAMSLQLQYRIH